VLVLPSPYCQQAKDHHEAVVELACYAHELVLGLHQKEQENVKLPLKLFSKSILVYAYEQPHPEDIESNVDVTHEVLGNVEVGEPVEETVDV